MDGDETHIERLLRNQADANAADQNGATPLHLAAAHDRRDCVRGGLGKETSACTLPQGWGHAPDDLFETK